MNYAKSCLLIDDDYDDQLVFSIIIEKLNKSILCVTVDNTVEALAKLEQDPAFIPDIIFLDLNIPGINGIDCLTQIKSNDKLAHIPVVIYTTSSRKEDMLKTQRLGAIDFITKSYHIAELTSKLNDLFSHRASDREVI
jgi:CheY-like chemotaxis protein